MSRPRSRPEFEHGRLTALGLRPELVEVLAAPAAYARRRLTRDTRAEYRRTRTRHRTRGQPRVST